jgi:hypothetical protein
MTAQKMAEQTDSVICNNRSSDCGDVSQITRRGFCNGLLLTSAASVVAAKDAPAETQQQLPDLPARR